MDSKKIGKVIAKRRKEKGMTQGELAERLIRQFLNGKPEFPKQKDIKK